MTKPKGKKRGRPVLSNLHGNPEPLNPGEASGAYRVRGPRDALDWFGALSASERGQLVARIRDFMADPATPPDLVAFVAQDVAIVEALGTDPPTSFDTLALEMLHVFDDEDATGPAKRRGGPKLSRAQLDVLRALAEGGRYVAHGSGRIVHQDGTETRVKVSSTGQTLKRLGMIDEDGQLTPKGREALARG